MLIHGLPERFWVVTKPSPVSGLEDILFPCDFGRLMLQIRGGLQEDEIVGIFADEDEARLTGMELLGEHPVRPQDALFAEVVVNVMVTPNAEEMTARSWRTQPSKRSGMPSATARNLASGTACKGRSPWAQGRWSCGTRSWP
jgi:hypothetical protein